MIPDLDELTSSYNPFVVCISWISSNTVKMHFSTFLKYNKPRSTWHRLRQHIWNYGKTFRIIKYISNDSVSKSGNVRHDYWIIQPSRERYNKFASWIEIFYESAIDWKKKIEIKPVVWFREKKIWHQGGLTQWHVAVK